MHCNLSTTPVGGALHACMRPHTQNQPRFPRISGLVYSVRQLSHFGLDIDDQSSVIPGHKQCMITPDLWIIPFNIVNS